MASLTNADFRSLLNTSDQSVVYTQPKKKHKTSFDEDSKREKRKQKYLRTHKGPNSKNEGEKLVEEGYRDRASERRKCTDEFYQQCADELNEMKLRSIEESKFLGGDIEHTHLVKGLDFALLLKIRNELEKNAQNEKLREEKESRLVAANRLRVSTAMGRLIFKEMYEELHPHSSLFNHKLNKIQNYLLRVGNIRHKENFGENSKWMRMSYVFNLNFDTANSSYDDIPILQLNSKESVKKSNNNNSVGENVSEGCNFVPYLHKNIIDELIKVMEWHMENKKRKKGERLLRRVDANDSAFTNRYIKADPGLSLQKDLSGKTKKSAKNDDDDDIFVGAGGFDASAHLPEESKEEKEKEKEKEKRKRKSYFSDAAKGQEKEKQTEKEEKEKTREIKEDIIREEEGMEVEEDDLYSSNWQQQTVAQYSQVLSAPNGSSTAAIYGLSSYTYANELNTISNNPTTISSYPSNSRVDKNATPFVSTEPPKIIKSGTTTVDQDKGFYSVFKRDETAFKKRGKEDDREKDPSYISDTYMECYPGFGAEVAFEAYSDDEEDRTKMDMGRQKQVGAKHKHQFKNENDWESYQLRKEALPKAAFQYGRKMDDNRVTRRRKKLNTEEEWKKIEKMIGDKKKKHSRDEDDD